MQAIYYSDGSKIEVNKNSGESHQLTVRLGGWELTTLAGERLIFYHEEGMNRSWVLKYEGPYEKALLEAGWQEVKD